MIGPVCSTPIRSGEPAPLEDRDHGAERGQHREQEAEGRLQRDQDRAEDHDQQQEGQADDQRQVRDQRVVELLREVDVHRGAPVTRTFASVSALMSGARVPDGVHQVLGRAPRTAWSPGSR